MHRRVAATLAVAALITLAGCSALPVFDRPASTPAATPSPTAAGTSTAAPTPTATPIEYPDGYGQSGVEDPDAAATNHRRTLAGYEGYRFRFDVGVGDGNGTRDAFVYLLRAEHASETALEIRDDADTTRFQYFEDDRLYVKLVVGDNESYNSTDHEYVPRRLTGIQFVAPLFEHVEYGGPDIRRTDNGTLYRYRSETVTNPGAILPSDVTADDVESFDVELVVHEDGYVRGFSYEVVTTDGTKLAALGTVAAVNKTTVDRPDWYDRAAEA